jgi:hypothetical protein
MMKLNELPDDILINILMRIDPSSLYSISKTSIQMYNVISKIIFKKILILNNKPMTQYNTKNRLNFFSYIFDSYAFGNIENIGIPFEDNNHKYIILHINSNYITHILDNNSIYSFIYKGVENNDYDNIFLNKPEPIIVKKINMNMVFCR